MSLSLFRFCPVCGSADFQPHDARSKRCGACGFTYYLNASASTVAVIRDAAGRLLVVRRAKAPAKGTLDLPGGFVDPGETLHEGCIREVREETGVKSVHPVAEDIYSLEVLTVDGHEKRGEYVPSHLHMNVTYLLEADDHDALTVCEAENSGVAWFTLDGALKASTEPWFVERIYKKLNAGLARL